MDDDFIKLKSMVVAAFTAGDNKFSTPVKCLPALGKLGCDGSITFSVELDNGIVVVLSLNLKQ